jgi:hypothetical protein
MIKYQLDYCAKDQARILFLTELACKLSRAIIRFKYSLLIQTAVFVN